MEARREGRLRPQSRLQAARRATVGLAGGKVAKLDRIEWVSIPDSQTAINALISGEIDMIEAPAHDLLSVLEKDKNVEIVIPDTLGST